MQREFLNSGLRALCLRGAGMLFFLLAIACPAISNSYQFEPTKDAFVKSNWPDRNYGRRSKLGADSTPVQVSYLQFHITGIVGVITSASLRIYSIRGNPNGAVVQNVMEDWSERTITFNTQPLQGTLNGIQDSVGDETWIDVPLSIPGKNGLVNLAITTPGKKALRFYSRESATPPLLLVETTVPADPVILAAGDIACNPASPQFNNGNGTATECHMKATSDLLLSATDPSAILLLGDNQYDNGTFDQYAGSFDLSWGRAISLIHPAPGNHEYNTPGGAGYYQYFGDAAGNPAKGYYSFDVGSWHIIALNSNCAAIGGCDAGSAQEQWLRNDLAAHPNACTLAYWHHPRFSSGPHGDDTITLALWTALYEANADLVLVGHDHDYERFAAQTPAGVADSGRGIRQFVVGTGGKSLYPTGTPKPNSEVRRSDTFGILKLTLSADRYAWEFVPENGSSFTDTGVTLCH